MLQLQGNWFDGKTSLQTPVTLRIDTQGMVFVHKSATQELLLQSRFKNLEVSARIGDTPRYVYFPNGEKFETYQHAELDALCLQHCPSLFNKIIYQLETHLLSVLLMLVAVIAFSWASVQYGLPAAAQAIATALPAKTMERAGVESLQLLDRLEFSPSKLSEEVQARLQAHFAPALSANKNLNLKVVFRQGGKIGANAFALPDGTLVFTDEIVQLAQHDDELLAVLAHEIGHIKHRHSLRSAISGSVLSFAVAMLTGDLAATGNLLASLPLLLTTMSYSRDFEREADAEALKFLDAQKIPRHNFVTLMERLSWNAHCDFLIALADDSGSSEGDEQDEAQLEDKNKSESLEPEALAQKAQARELRCTALIEKDTKDSAEWMGYFSSHPATEERLKVFRD